MGKLGLVARIAALSGCIVVGGVGSVLLAPVAQAADTPSMSIEELYSLPSVVGTAPGGQAWSPDGKRLAFL